MKPFNMSLLGLCLMTSPLWSNEAVTLSPSYRIMMYDNGTALIQESMKLDLKEGWNKIALSDFPKSLKPESIYFQNQDDFYVAKQSQYHAEINAEQLLEQYLNQEVMLIYQDGREETIILLAHQPEIIFQRQGRIEFKLPEGARLAFPVSEHKPKHDKNIYFSISSAKNQNIETSFSYLIHDGLSWDNHYRIQLKDDTLSLEAWADIRNDTGKNFDFIEQMSKLVGDIPEYHEGKYMPVAAMAMRAAPLAEASVLKEAERSALGEHYLYTLPQAFPLKHGEQKQILLFSHPHIATQKEYLFRGEGNQRHQSEPQKSHIRSVLHWQAPEALAEGKALLYRDNSTYLGSQRIDNYAKGETVELDLGAVFDVYANSVVVEEKRLDWGLSNKISVEQKHRIIFSNRKKEVVSIKARETFYGDWRITASNIEAHQIHAKNAEWKIDIPAEGETILEYTVLFNQ